MLTKVELRTQFKKARDLFFESHPDASKKLARNLQKVVGPKDSVWGTYSPYGSEADPHSNDSSVTWAYPKIRGELLDFYIPSGNWVLNSFKIKEPKEDSKKVSLQNLKGLLIPGVVFDRKGHRIGSGKGFFDKTLENYQGLKIGVAYSIQISESELPAEAHDICMDIVVTEKEIIQVSERKAS